MKQLLLGIFFLLCIQIGLAYVTIRVGSKERCSDMEQALDQLASLPQGTDVVILLMDEKIRVKRTLVIDPTKVGSIHSLRIKGRENGGTTFLSSIPISSKDLKPVQDGEIAARMRKELLSRIREYDLAAHNIDIKRFADKFLYREGFAELYLGGKRLPLSRYPNQSSMIMKRVVETDGRGGLGGVWEYTDPRHSAWLSALEDGVWTTGFWRVPWQPETVRIHSIDTLTRQVVHAKSIGGGIGSKYHRPNGSGQEPYYVINLPEEIDRPGEWSIDFKRRKLYFYPPASSGFYELAFRNEPILRIEQMKGVVLENITFEGGASDGVVLKGGDGNRIVGCSFRNLSGAGVVIDMGFNHWVSSSDFYDLGKEGIWAMGGDRRTLTSCNHRIENNYFTRFGQVKDSWASAVRLGRYTPSGGDSGGEDAVGIEVRHNLVHDAPHAAFLYVGNLNLFEYNEVFDIAKNTGDVGAFYTRHDWTARGNVVRHNFIHHIPRANGTYHDDGHAGDSVYCNIIHQALAGTMIGGGHYNVVCNNIYLNCIHAAVSIDARGVQRNYTASNRSYIYRFKEYNFDSPNWQKFFPDMKHFLSIDRPDLPHDNVIENNYFIDCKWGLRSGTKEDFRFSPRLSGGTTLTSSQSWIDLLLDQRHEKIFEEIITATPPIQLSKIGLYKDAYRTSLPSIRKLLEGYSREAGFNSDEDVRVTNRGSRKN